MRREFFLASVVGMAFGLGGGCADRSPAGLGAPRGSTDPAPLVGTWTYSGRVPAVITIALTFNADGTFSALETVAPPTLPAGAVPSPGCQTTDTYAGTYVVLEADAKSTVTWTYDTGTVNAILGCDDPSVDRAGTAATPEGIAAFTAQNILPPAMEAFTQTPTTLVLTPGFGTSTTFAKFP